MNFIKFTDITTYRNSKDYYIQIKNNIIICTEWISRFNNDLTCAFKHNSKIYYIDCFKDYEIY
jgi:hypothetical protein